MNFLAHTYLSFEHESLIVGNYLGDFIKNKEVEKLPEGIKLGIKLHRSIDSYTDTHEMVKKGTSQLHASMGKYAPVALDIYFDFFLSKHWAQFNELTLAEYCTMPYQVLLKHEYLMSERLASRMNKMVADRWLENYQTYAGIERVFGFLAKRATFPSNLLQAPEILKERETSLEEAFLIFFPDLISHCRRQIANIFY
jgi:acyl carrier protein phosphodiesterase